MAAFANIIYGSDGNTLVVGYAVAAANTTLPLCATITHLMTRPYHLHHTKTTVAAVVKHALEDVAAKFPGVSKYLTCDGNCVNGIHLGEFPKHKGITKMYCLMHLINARVLSIRNCTSRSGYSFVRRDGSAINISAALNKKFRNLLQHLLSSTMSAGAAKKVLRTMAKDSGSPHWLILESDEGDEHYEVKQALKHCGLVYQAILNKTAGDSETVLAHYDDFFRNHFRIVGKVPFCWGPSSWATLETARACNPALPLMFFTLCFDEFLRDANLLTVDGEICVAANQEKATNVVATVAALCNMPEVSVNNTFGEFPAKKVMFISDKQMTTSVL